MGDLTHELMVLSRGGAPVKELGSIWETLNQATHQIKTDSGLSIEQSIPDDLWPVPHDARKRGAVFRNVFQNAVEAMPGGGVLSIQTQNLRVENGDAVPGLSLKPGDYVHIAIQDTGKGIDAESLAKIFDPYFSTKPMGVQKGMGLGLATAYAIVKKHGGEITIQSTPDVGTTVHIYLPAQPEEGEGEGKGGKPVSSETQTTVADQQGLKQRILLMDDEE